MIRVCPHQGARLPVPDLRPAPDALTAATAGGHGETMVTENVADFETICVEVADP